MKTVRKYLAVYGEFFRTSVSESLSFRMNFPLQTLMNLVFLCTSFLTAGFIFNHIETIGFWNREEFFFFLAFVFAVDQTHYLLFTPNFWNFSQSVRLGNLDFHLLKPVSAFFIVFTRHLAVPGLFSVTMSYGLLIYFGRAADLGFFSWVMLPFCLFLALALLWGIEVLISLLNFITVEGGGVNQIRLQIQHFLRWPDFVYQSPFRLWMLPFLAVTSFPVRFLLDFQYRTGMAFMAGGTLALWLCVIFLWPKAVNLYESPSS